MKEKRIHRVYEQEFRDRAVEMVIHNGKSQAEVAVHGGRWWRSKRIKWPAATRDPANESEPEFRTDRTRETAHAGPRREPLRNPDWQDLVRLWEWPTRAWRPGAQSQPGLAERA